MPVSIRPSRMLRRMRRPAAAIAALVLTAVSSAQAADASALGRDLTPLGGEKAGNLAGTIPAWSDEPQADGSFKPGHVLRADAWKHKGDKPLYSIDAHSMASHQDQLTPGQQALLKQFPGFRMDVYPTRRTCSSPAFVAENTRKNVGFAKLGADGWSLKDAWAPGIPFPMPTSGVEAMWNQKLRYRGIGTYGAGATYLSPRPGQTEWIAPRWMQTFYWPWAEQGSHKLSESGHINTQTYFTYTEPVALVGQAAIITDYFDQPGTDAYYYFPGQRRVRRMPAYAYDAPQIGFENQYNMDDTQVIMGALDRFDWKLVGKKEILVPYNSFGAFDFKSPWQTVITPSGLSADHRRYELHRVWVVEATVKSGMRHQSPHRTYYLDEDSWNAVLAEDYDPQGKLTKVREGYLIPAFEVGACDVSAFVQYNLLESRVLFDFSPVGAGTDVEYAAQPIKPAMRSSFYTPDNLRAISER